jgi:hypothetical protein
MTKVLASMRSNMNFSVDYDTKELTPAIELILLAVKAGYKIKKGDIEKESQIEEMRITLSPQALNQVIAQLQVQAQQLQVFEQAGEALNSVLRTMIKKS